MNPSSTLRRAAGAGALALTLAVAGCGGDDGGDAGASPASVLPANSPVYVEVKVRPEGDLRADAEAVLKKVLRTDDPGAALEKVLDDALDDGDGDKTTFKDDIDPWLGDTAGVAITSLRDPQNPDFAVAIASKDNDKAMEALEDDDTTEATYKDTKYLKDADDDTAAGIVGDTLVIGTEPGFRAAVDASKGEQQLDDSDGLEAAREGVSGDDALGFAYVDIAKALTAVSASQPLLAGQLDPLKKLLGGATTIGAALGVSDGAIRVEAAQIGGPAPKQQGDPAKILADLPADTVLGAGLGEVGAMLQGVLDQISEIGPVAGQDPQVLLQALESQLGLSIQKDLLSWMGEGAIFVQGGSIADLGGGLVVTSTAPQTTKATLRKIQPLLRGAGVPVVDRAPAGAEAGFRVPLQGAGGIELLVGIKGDRFVIGVNPKVVQDILAGNGDGRLGDEADFKAAAAKLGDGIQPSFFLDVPAVVTFLGLAAGSDEDFQKAKPYLDAFGVLVAGAKRDGDTNRSRLVLTVK